MQTEPQPPEPPKDCFPTTQWTALLDVVQQGDSAAAFAALDSFCLRYRPAVRNFFVRRGVDPHQAEEYTQNFFLLRILKPWEERNGFLHKAERRELGKFRSFLCHVLWQHLQDEWRRRSAVTTGGQAEKISLDNPETPVDVICGASYEAFGRDFDRELALEIIQKAAERSRHSRYHLAHLRGEMSQAKAATELGILENAFKVAHHRFRERLFRDVWDEVSSLVGPDEAEVRTEIGYLMSLFVGA